MQKISFEARLEELKTKGIAHSNVADGMGQRDAQFVRTSFLLKRKQRFARSYSSIVIWGHRDCDF